MWVPRNSVPNILDNSWTENTSKKKNLLTFLNTINPHALVLSGGNDIRESPDRDETEFAMIDYAEQKKLPILGICRGMQMMAYKVGTTPIAISGHAGEDHNIRGEIQGKVNSYHNFCIPICPEVIL